MGCVLPSLSSLKAESQTTTSKLGHHYPTSSNAPQHTMNSNNFATNRGTGRPPGYFGKTGHSLMESYFILEEITWFYKYPCSQNKRKSSIYAVRNNVLTPRRQHN